MGMGIGALQVFEKLRGLADRARSKAFAGKSGIQATPAPVDAVFDLLEDFDKRVKELEKERDERGVVVVGEPSKSLVDFVESHLDYEHRGSSDQVAHDAIRALMGRVLYHVEKVQKQYEAEARAAAETHRTRGTVKDLEWMTECRAGQDVAKKIAAELRAMLQGGK